MEALSSIRVVVRARPFTEGEAARLRVDEDDGGGGGDPDGGASAEAGLKALRGPLAASGLRNMLRVVDDRVLVFDPRPSGAAAAAASRGLRLRLRDVPGRRERKFAFDRVFGQAATQQQLYDETTLPLLGNVMEGFNASVFAYGATGCGKTHTIAGTPEQPGIIFRAFADLFARIEAQTDREIEVTVSYLEIYNEQIRDLLVPGAGEAGENAGTRPASLPLRETGDHTIVAGLSHHRPATIDEVMMLVVEGNMRRTMSPTEANAVSSRSHAVLQVHLRQRDKGRGLTELEMSSVLNIIDLAGSERAASTRNMGKQMREGANINRSLLAVGKCITALCAGQQHIPYRDSKLTRLLKFSLGGNCRTVMIVCVAPSSLHADETYNTLTYANQAKGIKTKAVRNTHTYDLHAAAYVRKIAELTEINQAQGKELEELRAGRIPARAVAALEKLEAEAASGLNPAAADHRTLRGAAGPIRARGAVDEESEFAAVADHIIASYERTGAPLYAVEWLRAHAARLAIASKFAAYVEQQGQVAAHTRADAEVLLDGDASLAEDESPAKRARVASEPAVRPLGTRRPSLLNSAAGAAATRKRVHWGANTPVRNTASSTASTATPSPRQAETPTNLSRGFNGMKFA